MTVEQAIMPIKINELVQLISEKKKMDFEEAVSYLYNSAFYSRLSVPDAKWWYMSGINLYRELEKEKKAKQRNEKGKTKEALFFIFCTENFRIQNQMDGREVVALFSQFRVYDFLYQNYEILHTQGTQYIVEEIRHYIKNHQRK